MATAPTYCTHRQLKDLFPQVGVFDNKKADKLNMSKEDIQLAQEIRENISRLPNVAGKDINALFKGSPSLLE